MPKPIQGELADQIFDILVEECGANDMGRESFMQWATSDGPGNEFRFGGIFGMAGKIWIENPSLNWPNGFRVSGPNSDELAQKHNPDELVASLDKANERLKELG